MFGWWSDLIARRVLLAGCVLLVLLASAAPVEAISCQYRARRAKAEADVRALASAISMYSEHTGALPRRLDVLTGSVTSERGLAAGPFINAVPNPSTDWTAYVYTPAADGTFTIATGSESDQAAVRFGPDGLRVSFPSPTRGTSPADLAATVIVVALVLVALAWPWLRAPRSPAKRPATVREASAGQFTLAILLAMAAVMRLPSCEPSTPAWAAVAMVAVPVLLLAALAGRVWVWWSAPN